jgi:4-carboxymuconolactone decarboxylase
MKLFREGLACLFLIAAGSAALCAQQITGRAAAAEQLPEDINPVTRNRLPPIRLEELDDHGKQLIEKIMARGRNVTTEGGPTSIRANSPHVLEFADAVNNYLRNNAGIDPRLAELAILVTARAMDSRYVWYGHEKAALKVGLNQEIIDIVKLRKPITGLGEKEAAILHLGREIFDNHKVDPETFARALKLFGRQGLVNVVSLMIDYAASATLLVAFDQHLPAGEASTLPIP